MWTSDPRLWSIHYPHATLVLFVGLTLLFVWGNSRVERGGILDGDVILREQDPVRQMDQYVRSKVEEGFEGRELIPFVVHRNGVGVVEQLRKVVHLTDATRETFGDTVVSLSTVPAYHDTGETLSAEPYVTLEEISHPDFDLQEWKARVARDPAVFGLLVGRDWSWTAVVRYLSPGYDEIEEFRKTVEFIEGRQIPWWEWLWKKDIVPRDPAIGVGGWTMGRGLIDQGLNVDILTLVFLGVFLTLPVFWAALGSWRSAFLCVSVMVAGGFVWTRGAMGLLGLPERVFSLLAYASVIVQGTSFALHKFAALRESRAQNRAAGWQSARSIDGLIATTAMISAFGFATLWSFGLKPIRELGLVAALGVVWLLLLSVFFLPALDLLINGRATPLTAPGTGVTAPGRFFEGSLVRLVSYCLRFCSWLGAGQRAWGMVGVICGVFVVVGVLFAREAIVSRTYALEFIRGTAVEREARFLNQANNVGFEFLDLLVEPAQGGSLLQPHFLARAWELQTALQTIPGSRETTSILSTVHQIARESFNKPLPETAEEVMATFFLIEHQLAPSVQRQLYFPGGVRISVSYGTDDSVELGRLCEAVLARARKDFPDLKVNAFNKVPLYPQVDKYVREGKVHNVFTSQVGVALICGLLIGWRNRQLTRARLSPVWGGLVMSLPLFCATPLMGLVMWVFQIPLDVATASIGALAINAATDFSLYLAMAYQTALQTASRDEALQRAVGQEGKVIVADCLLNSCCFLPLISSSFLPVRQLGWMMAVMLVTCGAATLVCMATLLPRCVRRKKEISHAPHAAAVDVRLRAERFPSSWVFCFHRPGAHLPSASTAHRAFRVCLRRDEGVPQGEGEPFLHLRDGKTLG